MKSTLEKSTQGVLWAEQAFFVVLFGFLTSVKGKAFLMENPILKFSKLNLPLQVILFPIAALLETVELGLAIAGFSKAKNQNADKTAQLLVTVAKTSIVITAIVFGVHATVVGAGLPAIVPILFTIALSINTMNSVLRAVYHYRQMQHTSNDSKMDALHREGFNKHRVGAIVGIVLTGAIVGLFVLGISTPVGLGLLSGFGLAAMLVGIVLSLGSPKAVPEKGAIAHVTSDIKVPLLGESENLDSKIETKIQALEGQIKRTGTTNTAQRSKRKAKIAGLGELKQLLMATEIVDNDEAGPSDEGADIDRIISQHKGAGLFQSWSRQRGEVEALFDEVRDAIGSTGASMA